MIGMKDERLPKDLRQRNKDVVENVEGSAEMGGLSEERSEKGRGIKVERKGQQQGPMEKITKVAVQRSDK